MASTWLIVLCFALAATSIALGSDPTELEVTTLLTEPFARYKSLTALPNELEGYILDLLHEMEQDPDMAGMKFKVTAVDDGKYGSLVGGRWNGMIKKLADGAADLAAGPLTVNDDRKRVVEFLEPAFMTFDLAMLMRKRHASKKVQSISDLNSAGTKYRAAVVDGGSTARHLRMSAHTVMWSIMEGNRNASFLPSVKQGVKRVRESTDSHPYVFIGEEPMLEFHASQKPCDLTVVKGKETEIEGEYHLAVKKGYNPTVVTKLRSALTKLNDSGRLKELYHKWWKEDSECSRAPSSTALASGTAILVPILLAIMLRVSGE